MVPTKEDLYPVEIAMGWVAKLAVKCIDAI
jgi:hypothetical protein